MSGDGAVRRTAGGAHMLPGRYYRDPFLFSREQERLFARFWTCVSRADELPDPGSFRLVDSAGEQLLLLHDGGGEIRAFHNVCRHRASALCVESAGRLDGHIRCPYHGWTYAFDGRLLGAPNMAEVAAFQRGDYPLLGAACALWHGFVFVSLAEPPPQTLEAYLEPLAHQAAVWSLAALHRVHRQEYAVAANWKLIYQNYSECYHCPGVHPWLNRLTPYRGSRNDLSAGYILGGPMHLAEPAESMTMSGRRCAAPLPRVSAGDRRHIYYYTVFPGLFLSLHPDYVLVHRLEPVSVDETRVVCDWLFDPTAITGPDFQPDDAIAFWDLTNRQDWEMCERSQRGVGSRAYRPGPYAELESMLAAFDRAYLTAMGDEGAI